LSGGHDIAAEHIYRRFERRRLNLIELIPHVTALRVHDSSADADPATSNIPKPKVLLQPQIRGDFAELLQRGFSVLDDFLGENVWVGEIVRHFEAFVSEPENVEAGSLAVNATVWYFSRRSREKFRMSPFPASLRV
jgi:hypothetical protein